MKFLCQSNVRISRKSVMIATWLIIHAHCVIHVRIMEHVFLTLQIMNTIVNVMMVLMVLFVNWIIDSVSHTLVSTEVSTVILNEFYL